jgi:hypothetical protein
MHHSICERKKDAIGGRFKVLIVSPHSVVPWAAFGFNVDAGVCKVQCDPQCSLRGTTKATSHEKRPKQEIPNNEAAHHD